MPTTRQLRDVYRFPGFEPLATVHGVFGDPRAVVVTLQRRGKKRHAAPVGNCRRRFTIKDLVGYGTFPVATSVFISTSSFTGLRARGVSP
jgi:hypothetical protein